MIDKLEHRARQAIVLHLQLALDLAPLYNALVTQERMTQGKWDSLLASATRLADAQQPLAIVQRKPSPPAPCVHLGAEVRRQSCSTCRGHVEIKVFGCALFGEATTQKALPSIACCRGCESYSGVVH